MIIGQLLDSIGGGPIGAPELEKQTLCRNKALEMPGSLRWSPVLAVAIASAILWFALQVNTDPPEVTLAPPQPPDILSAYSPGALSESLQGLRQSLDCAEVSRPLATEVTSAPEPDDVWVTLPRSGDPKFPERFYGDTSAFPTRVIYRSKDLNPRDYYVQASDRTSIAHYVATELREIEKLETKLIAVAWNYVIAGIRSGKKRPLEIKQDRRIRAEVKSARERGKVLLDSRYYEGGDDLGRIYSVRGVMYGLRWSELPETDEARALIEYLKQNLSINVALWFRDKGLMTDEELRHYIERSYDLSTLGK